MTTKDDKPAATSVNTGNTAVHGDHDRVAMLSLRSDGTPDQNNPEIIGDREFAEAATREQFRQQAVSAVDTARAAEQAAASGDVSAVEDPSIAEVQAAHAEAEKAAEKAADATVGALFKDDAGR